MDALFVSISLLLLTFSFSREVRRSDVTYEELEKLDAICDNLDSCKLPRPSDTLQEYTCNCGPFCSEVRTCCLDSLYRGRPRRGSAMSCKGAHGNDDSSYFMLDSCPPGEKGNLLRRFCDKEDEGDLISLVPVTSLYSNVTYKNYFCFRCHEAGDAYRYWTVELSAKSNITDEGIKNAAPIYNESNKSWMAPLGKKGALMPVSLRMEVPEDIKHLPNYCVRNVISSCSKTWRNWTIRRKCNAYTSIIHFSKGGQYLSYRNPHCALCNYENLEMMLCAWTDEEALDGRSKKKKPFSFAHLLDINRSDGDVVGKITKCEENSIWDPFLNGCRALKCALPGYVVHRGNCILP